MSVQFSQDLLADSRCGQWSLFTLIAQWSPRKRLQSKASPQRLLAFYCLLLATFYNRLNGRESIQTPFLLLSLSVSLCLFVCVCAHVRVCAEVPKISLTQSHQDVVGIYKTTRCAQLEVCVCLCVFDSLLFSYCCLHYRYTHVCSTECSWVQTSCVLFFFCVWVCVWTW